MENKVFDSIIIGGGPAGLTAGIYLARSKARVLILNEGMFGGQMILTHEIANYPGIESISGYQLSMTMLKQAQSFGCETLSDIQISDLCLEGDVKTVSLKTGEHFSATTIIVATGGKSRRLGVVGEKELTGRGISYCATCDGDFFQDKDIIVVGGGNSAVEEAVSLTKYASSVTIVHQFDHFQAYKHAVEQAEMNPKIRFVLESKITEFSGDEKLEQVKILNLKTNQITETKIDGVFIFIGYVPNTAFLNETKYAAELLNQYGEIRTDGNMKTAIEGVFAAGDSREKRVRQITTSVSDGTIAALSAMECIEKKKLEI